MSNIEIELLANRPCAPHSQGSDGQTLFPQPRRLIHAACAPAHLIDAERDAHLDTTNPSDEAPSPNAYRLVSLDEL